MKLKTLSLLLGLAFPAAAALAASCPVPDTKATVTIGHLATAVPNLDADGAGAGNCTLNDLIAEAMLACVLMDHALRHRAQCGDVVRTTPVVPGLA